MVVVVLAVLAAAAVQREVRDPTAGLAADPSVLDPLTSAPVEVWRGSIGVSDILGIRHDLVLARGYADDRPVVTAYDAATGDLRWHHGLDGDAGTRLAGCEAFAASPAEAAAHVVCRVVTTEPSATGARILEATLLVLDARDGRTVRERRLTRTRATSAPWGADLVVTDVAHDGTLQVVREVAGTGRVRWRWEGSTPVAPGVQLPSVLPDGALLVADGTSPLVLSAAGSAVWAPEWLSTGRAPDAGGVVDVTALPDGELAVTALNDAGTRFAGGAVLDAGARERFPLPGPVLVPEPDDGSADDVVLTGPLDRGDVVALDRATGAELWRTRTGPVGRTLLLGGRLVVRTTAEVLAVDTGTGAVLWRADLPSASDDLFTDGRVVVVPTDDRGTRRLSALDAATGGVRWSVPVPDDVQGWFSNGGLLHAVRSDDMVTFGSP